MRRASKTLLSLIVGAVSALPLAAPAQTSGTTSTTTTTTSTTTSTTVPADRLIQQYTKLAGSEANATKLVTGLRDGSKEIKLSGSTILSRSTTITNPMAGKTMGYGNIDIVLAMAEKQMAGDSKATLNSVLTNPENGILTLRASGMGWGKIANTLGFKLGEVKGNAPSKDATGARKDGQASQGSASRDARGESRGSERGQVARAERPERVERPQKAERVEQPQRPERGGGK